MKTKQRITLDDVEKLSRGQRTANRIGSRAIGHHLAAFERCQYDLAIKLGYMTVNDRSRENLWNIWQKACLAKGWFCVILLKQVGENQGQVFQDGQIVFEGDLKQAKQYAKQLGQSFV